MKSEERHELKSNDLETLINRIKPRLEKHANKLVFGAIAIFVIGVISVVAMKNNAAARTAGWADMADAQTSEEYANIVDAHKGTAVARFAKLNQAGSLYEHGLQFMFSDRAPALADMKKAQELYKSLLEDKKSSETIRERALFGLARCLESTSGENTQEAIETYEQLVQEFPDSIHTAKAEERIKVLATDDAKSFYSWFQKQNPKPVDRTKPKDGDESEVKIDLEDNDKKEAAEKPEDQPVDKSEKTTGEKEKSSKKEEDKKPVSESKEGPKLEKPSSEKKASEKKETGKNEVKKKADSTEKKESVKKEVPENNADKTKTDK